MKSEAIIDSDKAASNESIEKNIVKYCTLFSLFVSMRFEGDQQQQRTDAIKYRPCLRSLSTYDDFAFDWLND